MFAGDHEGGHGEHGAEESGHEAEPGEAAEGAEPAEGAVVGTGKSGCRHIEPYERLAMKSLG